MQWFRALLKVIQAVVALLPLLSAWRNRREGRLEAEKRQLEEDQLAVRKASDARRGVDHSPDSVRGDARNRDAN